MSWPRSFFILLSLAVLLLRGSDGVADGHLADSQSQLSTTSNALSCTPVQNKHLLTLTSVLEKDKAYELSNRQLSSILFRIYVFGCVFMCTRWEVNKGAELQLRVLQDWTATSCQNSSYLRSFKFLFKDTVTYPLNQEESKKCKGFLKSIPIKIWIGVTPTF